MPVLSIQLLGNFRLLDGARPVAAVNGRRLQALLAYLLLDPGHPIPRDRIAAVFWPETTDAQARTNLRNLIHSLRAAWPDAGQYLLIDSRTLAWNAAAPYRLDVAEFEAAAAAGDIPGLQTAAGLYAGDLLPDLYDEWLESERRRLRSLYSDTLERLVGLLEASGRYPEAVTVAERLILLEPLQELHHVRLMRLYAQGGNRAAVRRAYRALTNDLREELGIEPDAATRDAYEEWLHYRPASTPPPNAARRTNLPAQLTSFVGRRREVAEVIELLRGPTARLVTLTGAGGSGKTRLALEVAANLVNDYAGGVWFVELAPLSDPALVASAVSSTLGMVEVKDRSPLDALGDFLRERQVLLLLDNCEHLTAAAADLANTLLRRCPELRILTTSREPLGIAGEAVWLAPTLSLPSPGDQPSVEDLLRYDAVRLFVERATAALSSFTLTGENAAAVIRVCRRLDGLPLAIELTAARVKLLRVEQIDERLGDRFRLLTGGSRDAPQRHQTLRALIDWSHDLLLPDEQRLLRRLSVFAGGFTLGAAEAVCDEENAGAALDSLTRLVNKSLVAADRALGRETRYTLHETIRQYAEAKLEEAGETGRLQERHAEYYCRLLEDTLPRFHYDDRVFIHLDRLETEMENLRAVMGRSLDGRTLIPEWGIRVATRLTGFWLVHDRMTEGGRWLDAALERAAAATPATRAALYTWVADLDSQVGDPQSRELATDALALFQTLEDADGIVRSSLFISLKNDDFEQAVSDLEQSLALGAEIDDLTLSCVHFGLMWVGARNGNYSFAVEHGEKAVAIQRINGDRLNQSIWMWKLGEILTIAGQYEPAIAPLQESLALARALKPRWGLVARILNGLGEHARMYGEYDRAIAHFRDALAITQEIGNTSLSAFTLMCMAFTLTPQGHLRQAATAICESMSILRQGRRLNDPVLWNVWQLAQVAGLSGEAEHAARLHGAAESLSENTGHFLAPVDLEAIDRNAARVRAQLGEEAYAAAWAEGQAMSLEEAFAYVLDGPETRFLGTGSVPDPH